MLTFSQENIYGNRIREERIRLGHTQSAWAKACGVSKTSQVSYEAGTYKPDVAYLSGAVALGADPVYLLVGRRMSTVVATEFDWKLAEDIMASIDVWAAHEARPTSAAKRMRLLKLFYAQFATNGAVDANDLQKTLALIA